MTQHELVMIQHHVVLLSLCTLLEGSSLAPQQQIAIPGLAKIELPVACTEAEVFVGGVQSRWRVLDWHGLVIFSLGFVANFLGD